MVYTITKPASVILVIASRNKKSMRLTTLLSLWVFFMRSAVKIRYIQIRNNNAQIAKISSTMLTVVISFANAFISATTVMHSPESVAETESRCNNSSRTHELLARAIVLFIDTLAFWEL